MESKNIRELRNKKRWSMGEVAKKLGVATSTYRGWEMGRKIPAKSIVEIAQLFGVSISYLLGNTDEQSENLKKAVYYLEEGLSLVKNSLP